MTQLESDPSHTLRDALRAVRQLRAELDDLRAGRHEPVAVVGVGCRFPGADDAGAFWSLLHAGHSAISELPEARWPRDAFFDPDPAAPGKMYSTRGGFVADADSFDAGFFGIAGTEAVRIDPQQRLLLEVCWQALENAGIPPESLEGSRTGVFVGMSSDDFGNALRMAAGGFDAIDPMVSLGTARSIAAGRVAYVLRLNGPVLQLDTSCSSSLLATHLACQSLRAGECDTALAGGVNLMLSPETTIGFSKLRALSPSGTCRAFDRGADGYVRGEGCGVLVLRRLSDVRRDGGRVLARVRGSAVNHDGRSNGMTAPNGRAQQAVIEEALGRAGIRPEDVDYVEAHGTGTPLGDPIEVAALARALRRDAPGRSPLWIGSVKPNIGHLEASAGAASLIKLVLALTHRTIPASLHFENPSPAVAWDSMTVRVAASEQAWPERARQPIAGVSAFGMSGTNVHLLLEGEPAEAEGPARSPRVDVLTLSAREPEALRELASRTAGWLAQHPELRIRDLCHTANTGRASLRHRLAIPAVSRRDLGEALSSVAAGEPLLCVRRSSSPSGSSLRRGVVLLFEGETAGAACLGRELPGLIPALRRALGAVARPVRAVLGVELETLLCGSGPVRFADPRHSQVALVALQISLARTWLAWGVEPSLAVGSGVGELAAACVAGALDEGEAIELAAERGACLARHAPEGDLLRVALGADPAESLMKELGAPVELASVEGEHRSVLGVRSESLAPLVSWLGERRVPWRRLDVGHPLHTSSMREAAERFAERSARTVWCDPAIPIVSASASHDPREGLTRGLDRPLQLCQAIRLAVERGADLLLSLGPRRSIWRSAARESAAGIPHVVTAGAQGLDARSVAAALGRTWAEGLAIDWRSVSAGSGQIVDMPGYPFQRRSYPLPGRALARLARGEAQASAEPGDALPERVAALPRPELPVPFAAPGGDLERSIAALWEQALGIAGIGRDDDFFDLGGDSLIATRITNLLRKELGVSVTPAEFLDSSSVRELARRVEAGETGGAGDPEIEALLAEVDELSEAEIESLLAERGDPPGGTASTEAK